MRLGHMTNSANTHSITQRLYSAVVVEDGGGQGTCRAARRVARALLGPGGRRGSVYQRREQDGGEMRLKTLATRCRRASTRPAVTASNQ